METAVSPRSFACSAQERDGSVVCGLGWVTRLGYWSDGGIFPTPVGFLRFGTID